MQIIEKKYETLFIIFLIFHFFLWDSYINKILDIRFLIILFPLLLFKDIKKDIFKKYLNIYIVLFFFILVIHYIYASKIIDDDINKIILLKILFLFFLALIINKNIEIVDVNFNTFINLSLYLLSFLIIFEMIIHLINSNFFFLKLTELSNCYDGYFSRFSKIFSEESHFGMVVPSLIITSVIINFNKKLILNFLLTQLLIIFTIFYALSLTFIISIILGSLISIILIRSIKIKIYFIGLIIMIIFASNLNVYCAYKFFNITYSLSNAINNKAISSFLKYQNNHYYNMKRTITIQNDSKLNSNNTTDQNDKNPHVELSSIIYLKAINNLRFSVIEKPLGLGFDNYNSAFTKYKDVSSKNLNKGFYQNWVINSLNKNDGSNNAVKLIVEFGVFSLILFGLILIFLFNKNFKLAFRVFFVNLIIAQLFLRGAGYFNGGFAVSFLVMSSLYFKNSHEKNL